MIGRVVYSFFCGVILLGAAALGALFFFIHNQNIDFSRLEHYNPGKPTLLLDDQGKEWARFQLDRREPIILAQVPEHLKYAFIAAEDWHFFDHHGISWRGMARSLLVNMYYGRRAQGASTITQQLVRLLFFDAEKTFTRKLKEQIYALLVEQQFTKDYILQTYLNHIYFGCGIYGVEAASIRFWGKSASDLMPHESATLAAIICSPNNYCPLLYPHSAQRRRNIILGSMHKLGYLSQEEYESSCLIPVTTIERSDEPCLAPHVKELLRLQLEDMFGKKALYSNGLVVYTTLNSAMQKNAERAFTRHINRLRTEKEQPFDGGLIAFDTATGDIKALVGGFDFATSKFNRVWHAQRQMGSVFKGMLYAAALEMGHSFVETAIDEPLNIVQGNSTWSPQNYNEKFEGCMTWAYALSRSNNIVAIKTLLAIGVQRVVDMVKRCHITSVVHPYPSLALGCVDATLKETAAMFNIFANNGCYIEPVLLHCVKDCWGRKLYKSPVVRADQVLQPRISGQVTKVLGLGMARLQKKSGSNWIDAQAIAKTGTTNDFRTCWFIGATPTLTTGIYIGCDDNRSMGKYVYPVQTAFPIWLDFNRCITHTRKTFLYDPTLQEVTIHERTGKHVSDDDPQAITILI